MNKTAVLAIWKKMLLVWILPWIVYTALLVMRIIPLWTGLFLPYLIAITYSRYTYSSFSLPKYFVTTLYIFSLYVGMTAYLWGNRVESVLVPWAVVIGVVVIVMLAFRGIRSWLSYMGTEERVLGATTYLYAILFGLWIYWLLSYKLISQKDFMYIVLFYALLHFLIYLLQVSGKGFQLKLENLKFHPGTYLGTIGNPLTFNLNLFMASLLAVWALYNLNVPLWVIWSVATVLVLSILYNTKRSVIIGVLVYALLLPVFLFLDFHFAWYWILIYYGFLVIVGWIILNGKGTISRRIRGSIFPLLYARRLKKIDVHPQIKFFAISTATTRWYLALSGLRTWLKSPLWGFGFEYVRRYLIEHRAIETYYAEHTKGYDRSHNMYVDILIEGGIIWLALLAYLMYPVGQNFMSYPAVALIALVIMSVLLFLFWDITFVISMGYLWGVVWTTHTSVYNMPLWAVNVVDAILLLIVLLTLFRYVADMYKGLARAIIPRGLDMAREEADRSLAICPFPDHNIVWRSEVVVKYIQVLDAKGSSPALAAKLATSITEYEDHIRITNYPDSFLAYLGYAYGTLYRLGCKECLEKALYYFEQSMELNPFNEATISTYANFAGNIKDWDRACRILETIIHAKYSEDPDTFAEHMKDVFYDAVKTSRQFVLKTDDMPEDFDIDGHAKGRLSWQAGRVSPNLMKMYIFCLVQQGRHAEAKKWLRFYENYYKDADPAFVDEMFLKIKLGQLRNI